MKQQNAYVTRGDNQMQNLFEYTTKAVAAFKKAIVRFVQGGNTPSNQETKTKKKQSDVPEKKNVRSSARYSPWRSEYPDNYWIRWG